MLLQVISSIGQLRTGLSPRIFLKMMSATRLDNLLLGSGLGLSKGHQNAARCRRGCCFVCVFAGDDYTKVIMQVRKAADRALICFIAGGLLIVVVRGETA